jgi:hypothetical protein
VWQRSIPVDEMLASGEEEGRLLLMLASGLEDEAITDRFGAHTRFQLGIQAVRQGWL